MNTGRSASPSAPSPLCSGVVDQPFGGLDVVLGLALVAAGRLGRRDQLQQRPEEPHVQVPLGAAHRRGRAAPAWRARSSILGRLAVLSLRPRGAHDARHRRRLRRPRRRATSVASSPPMPRRSSLRTSLRSSVRSFALRFPRRPRESRRAPQARALLRRQRAPAPADHDSRPAAAPPTAARRRERFLDCPCTAAMVAIAGPLRGLGAIAPPRRRLRRTPRAARRPRRPRARLRSRASA